MKRRITSGGGGSPKTTDGCMFPLLQLPREILIEILCGLPIKTLLSCACVCKALYDLIKLSPDFARLHLSRSPVQVLLRIRFSPALYLLESTLDGNFKEDDMAKFMLPRNIFVLNSCNGFLSLGDPQNKKPTMVFNPVTGEYIYLPTITSDGLYDEEIEDHNGRTAVYSGFGFCRKSRHFKVVRLVPRKGKRMAEVYTLGDRFWRCIGFAPEKSPSSQGNPFSFENGMGVFLRGVYYWAPDDGGDRTKNLAITCFDFETEKFGRINFPEPCYLFDLGKPICIGVLQGCLALKINRSRPIEQAALWTLSDYSSNGNARTQEANAWRKMCDFNFIDLNDCPIKCLEDGRILMNRYGSNLNYLDTKTGNMEVEPGFYFEISGWHGFISIVFSPSFLSFDHIMKYCQFPVKVHHGLQ